LYIYIYVYIHIYIYTYLYIHMCICTYKYMCVCTHVHLNMTVYIYIHTHIHIYLLYWSALASINLRSDCHARVLAYCCDSSFIRTVLMHNTHVKKNLYLSKETHTRDLYIRKEANQRDLRAGECVLLRASYAPCFEAQCKCQKGLTFVKRVPQKGPVSTQNDL